MIENEIYCYIDGFLKWNISEKVSYIIWNKKFTKKMCILSLRNKRKSIFERVIIRYHEWKKITKETDKIMIKNTYRWNNRMKFSKFITRGKFVLFRSTIDTNRSRIRRIQFVIFIFVKKVFCCNFSKKCCGEASRFKVLSSLSFSSLDVSEIISWMVLS